MKSGFITKDKFGCKKFITANSWKVVTTVSFSYILQQLVSVRFKSQMYIQNFACCWGWYVRFPRNTLEWFVWAVNEWNCFYLTFMHLSFPGASSFTNAISLLKQFILLIDLSFFDRGSFPHAAQNLLCTVTHTLPFLLQTPLWALCMYCCGWQDLEDQMLWITNLNM